MRRERGRLGEWGRRWGREMQSCRSWTRILAGTHLSAVTQADRSEALNLSS